VRYVCRDLANVKIVYRIVFFDWSIEFTLCRLSPLHFLPTLYRLRFLPYQLTSTSDVDFRPFSGRPGAVRVWDWPVSLIYIWQNTTWAATGAVGLSFGIQDNERWRNKLSTGPLLWVRKMTDDNRLRWTFWLKKVISMSSFTREQFVLLTANTSFRKSSIK